MIVVIEEVELVVDHYCVSLFVPSYKVNLGVLVGLGRVCRLRLHPDRGECVVLAGYVG